MSKRPIFRIASLVIALLMTILVSSTIDQASAVPDDAIIVTDANGTALGSLHGRTVAGDLYAVAQVDGAVQVVYFYVDAFGGRAKPYNREREVPYTLSGDRRGKMNAFDTTTLADGPHTVTADVVFADHRTTVTATFTVANAASPASTTTTVAPTTTAPTTTVPPTTTTTAPPPTTTTTAPPTESPSGSTAHSDGLITTVDALARPDVQTAQGSTISDQSGAVDRTYDLRSWWTDASLLRSTSTDVYPVKLGNSTPLRRAVVVGGLVAGRTDRTMKWDDLKRNADGTALLMSSTEWSVVDGLRADNVMDGLRLTRQGSRFAIRNTWHTYVRDDWFENDNLLGGTIRDVLVDGTYVFLSARPGRNSTVTASNQPIVIENALIRLERMPYDTDVGGSAPAAGSLVGGKAHAQPFKWSADAPPVHMKNSIIVVPGMSVNGASSMNFPAGTYENVTVITENGKYPGRLPSTGVRVTSDMGVWDSARTTWIQRHGCSAITSCDGARMVAPR